MALSRQRLRTHPFILLFANTRPNISSLRSHGMGREIDNPGHDSPQPIHLLPPPPRQTLGRRLALQRHISDVNLRSYRGASILELLLRSLKIGVLAFPARWALEGDVRHGTAVSGGLVHVYVSDDRD